MTKTRFHLLPALFLLAVTPCAFASADKDRDDVGLDKLGIGETFGRWPGGVVGWKYNPTNRPAYFPDDNAFVDLLEEAMDEIEGVSDVDFQFLGIDSGSTVLNYGDGVVTIGWDNLNGSAGVAGPASQCTAQQRIDIGYCQYVDGAVRFNYDGNDINWDQGDAESSEIVLVQVATHELLHLLGLGHSEEPVSIMYANPYTFLTHLRDDDISGLRSMYGRSPTPALPDSYSPPAMAIPGVLQNSYLADEGDIQAQLTTVDDSETDAWLGLTWEALPGAHPTVEMYVTGPQGYTYSKRMDDRDCGADPGFYCIFWFSAVSMATLQTFPGLWTIYVVINGELEDVHVLDNQFTPPVINTAPDTQVAFDRSYGEAPLTVNATVTSFGDSEGDDVSGTWHIPTVGEVDFDFGASNGQDTQQLTFTQDGVYEIYVAVIDDGPRYGMPGSGSAAGQGFQRLYRKIITVGDVKRAVALADINGNGAGEVAVMIEASGSGNNIVYVRDSETDALISTINFGSDPDAAMEVVDGNNDGSPEIAVLQTTAFGNVRVRLSNSLSAATVNTIFYGNTYSGIDLAIMPDLDNNGFPELAVLGVNSSDGIRVQARDAVNDTANSTSYFGSNAYPIDLAVIPGYVGGTVPAVAVQARIRSNHQTRVQLRNAATGGLLRNMYYGDLYEPIQIVTIEDVSTDGLSDIVQLSRRIDSGAIRIVTKASSSGATIASAFTGDIDLPVAVAAINDINSNGTPDIALLVDNPSGVAQVKVWDGGDGGFIRNIFMAGAGSPRAITVLPDGTDGGGAEEVAVLGDNAGQDRVQIKDSDSGAQVNVVDFP